MRDSQKTNKQLRFEAYTEASYKIRGRMGFGNRRPLPACVQLGIRREKPQKDGCYKGFQRRKQGWVGQGRVYQ